MVNTYMQHNSRNVTNNAGGNTVFQVDDMTRLERFLILGTVGGSFYVGEKALTDENLRKVEQIIANKGIEAVQKIVEIGRTGRAPKHDPALVAYAMACSTPDETTRAFALAHMNDIVRTGTHLFHFIAYIEAGKKRGWGRAFRRAVGNWYTGKPEKALAYQIIKYKQRDGWSHRDVLRLAHPQATSAEQNGLLRYAVTGTLEQQDTDSHNLVAAAIEAGESTDINRVIDLVKEFNLPMEVIPTQFKNKPEMWEALAPQMGMTALLRNLRNMHKDGYLVQGSEAVRTVRERLLDQDALRKARIHPAHVFMAQKNATEIPTPVFSALEEAFYASFGNVVPTNKRIMLALDVSGSMSTSVQGVANAREWSALQAMVTARSEPYAEFYAFTGGITKLDITANDSLRDVNNKIKGLPYGDTDCSLPMYHANKNGLKFDAFCVYTDNETWTMGVDGKILGNYFNRWHKPDMVSSGNPMKELNDYRSKSGVHDAKLVVTAITSTGFSIADPRDFNTLDVVGFDANAPAIIADFIRN